MQNTILKAGLYRRISTGEQSKFSLEAQEEQLRQYCREHNLEVYQVYSDMKGRFTFEERSGLMQLLDDVEQGRINLLLVTELDRLAGDEGILGYIKYSLKKAGVNLISINEQGKVKNEYQELIESILTAVARFENTRKKLRCRRGISRAKQEGKILNRIPYGYKLEKKGTRDRQIQIDEESGKAVVEIFQRYAIHNQSMYRISRDLGISKSNVRYILQNPFYYDAKLNGDHEPLISETLFEKARNNE